MYRWYRSFWNEKEAKILFLKLLFYKFLIEKPCNKHLNNIDLLGEFPDHDEWSIVKISEAFKRYAKSYIIEITDSKDPLILSEASKSCIEDLFIR